MDLQSLGPGSAAIGEPRAQPRTDLRREVAEEVSAWPVHPHLWRFLIRRIGDQIERVARLEGLQMAIPVGESDAVDRSSEVRRAPIRKGRTIAAHTGFNVRITVH